MLLTLKGALSSFSKGSKAEDPLMRKTMMKMKTPEMQIERMGQSEILSRLSTVVSAGAPEVSSRDIKKVEKLQGREGIAKANTACIANHAL